jgi:hypothetical protein
MQISKRKKEKKIKNHRLFLKMSVKAQVTGIDKENNNNLKHNFTIEARKGRRLT